MNIRVYHHQHVYSLVKKFKYTNYTIFYNTGLKPHTITKQLLKPIHINYLNTQTKDFFNKHKFSGINKKTIKSGITTYL